MSIIMNCKVTKIYPLTERKAKDWRVFKSQQVIIMPESEFESEFPSTILLTLNPEFEKHKKVLNKITVDSIYEFGLNFRTREWTNPETNQTSVFFEASAWKAADVALANPSGKDSNDTLPF